MTVDSHCSVAISSLSEVECLPHDPSTEPRATDDTTKYSSSQGSTDNTAGIIGGTFATVIVIVVAIVVAIIAIAALILKNRGAGEKLVRFNPLSLSSLSHTHTHTHTHSHTHFLSLFRHEKTLVGASAIPTSSNSAYEMVRKKTGRLNRPQPVGKEGAYEVPLPSPPPPPPDQPLPPLPPSSESEETEQVYETIPY